MDLLKTVQNVGFPQTATLKSNLVCATNVTQPWWCCFFRGNLVIHAMTHTAGDKTYSGLWRRGVPLLLGGFSVSYVTPTDSRATSGPDSQWHGPGVNPLSWEELCGRMWVGVPRDLSRTDVYGEVLYPVEVNLNHANYPGIMLQCFTTQM